MTYDFTDKNGDCATAGITYVKETAVAVTDNQWTFVASYANKDMEAEAAKTYSTDLNAAMAKVDNAVTYKADAATEVVAGAETVDLTSSDEDKDKDGAVALGAFGVALAATYLF